MALRSHRPSTAAPLAIHALTLLVDHQHHADLARYAQAVELIVLTAPNPHHVRATDFGHSHTLIDGALAAARAFLDAGGSSLRAPRRRRYFIETRRRRQLLAQ